MREKWFREHIWWMSFILSLMVVWVHSENVDLFLGEIGRESLVYRLEFFFAQTLGQIAVPGFFMISAYLFYRNFQFSKTVSKWKSRCKSLLLPYVLWNILYYLGYVVVTRLSFVKKIIGKEPVAFGLKELFQAVAYYKYNPVFWYLFQLLLLVVLAPFLYWIICRKWSGLLWLLLLITALWKNVSLPILNLDALFYYSAAGYAVLFSEKVEGENTSSGKKNLVCHSYSLLAYPMVSWKTWSNFTFYTGPYCSDPFTGSAYFLQYFKRNTLQDQPLLQ